MKKIIRLTESDLTKMVKRVIKENEEEGMVVNKVENFVEKPKVQNYINNMISKLSDEEIQELENSLEDLGIDGNSSAEEIHDIVVSNSESQNTEMTEENENPKDKVAEILHRIGAGNIAAWGGVPAAIAIGSATGMPMGFAISWGVTGLLMGIAHLLNNKKVTESDLTRLVRRVIQEDGGFTFGDKVKNKLKNITGYDIITDDESRLADDIMSAVERGDYEILERINADAGPKYILGYKIRVPLKNGVYIVEPGEIGATLGNPYRTWIQTPEGKEFKMEQSGFTKKLIRLIKSSDRNYGFRYP
jgi:hypothetical protein